MSDPDTLPPSAESHVPSRLPDAPRMPSDLTLRTDPLTSLADRVGALSDELNDPDGLLHRLFADLEDKGARRELRAQRRHRQVMKALAHLTNGVTALSADVAKLKPKVEEHEARLHLLPVAGQQQ